MLRTTTGNLFFSSVSLELLLAIIYFGSKGKVADEIQSALNLPVQKNVVKAGYNGLIRRFITSKNLYIATRMFVSDDFEIKHKFGLDTQKYFYSPISKVPFSHNTEEAVQTINSYVSKKTHGKIQDFLQTVSQDTKLILVNALYFNADWEQPFEAGYQFPFYISKVETVQFEMMELKYHFNYEHNKNLRAQILELPYKGNEYSMLIFLPDDVDGLQSVEDKLVNSNFEDVINGLSLQRGVLVKIPKFKLEQEINLEIVLREMGMISMFEHDADFSGMSDVNGLYVSKVVQKTFINVNENGTEAAAATGIAFEWRLMDIPEVEFIANHPFLFTIVGKPDNSVLFMGRFVGV